MRRTMGQAWICFRPYPVSASARVGFTLIELLVVIAIIAILANSVPCVQPSEGKSEASVVSLQHEANRLGFHAVWTGLR